MLGYVGKKADGSYAPFPRLVWMGDVPHQKWMNFYTKVLSKFSGAAGLKLTLRVEGVSPQKVDETKVALRELGLKDSLESE